MSAKLLYFYRKILKILQPGFFFIALFSFSNGYSQDCNQDPLPGFTPTTINNNVNWQQFPEFSLPFKIIYGGQAPFGNPEILLKRGFTHISNPHDLSGLQGRNRALIYTGVAFPNKNQPWEVIKSPWGNDMNLYQNKWAGDLTNFKAATGSQGFIDADLFVYDIERQQRSNDSILILKNTASTPAAYKTLGNEAFIEQYKKDLQQLYASTLGFGRSNGLSTAAVSSYADTPVWNTFTNIQGFTWTQWKQNPAVTNYLTYNFEQKNIGGNFYSQLNFLTPSAYYYYDYPHPFASEYLSYLMFQLEANRAWSAKDNIVFVWMKYSFNQEYKGKFIKPWMAEATAIFPFFAGARGIWFWDDFTAQAAGTNYSSYEYFMKGLYRLSLFKDMFTGDYKLIEETSARDYNENKKPIWRGVQKGNNILIAAHNPNAKSETELTDVLVTYGNWSKLIRLKGYEVFLCQYDLNAVTGLEGSSGFREFTVYPNPAVDEFTLEYSLRKQEEVKVYVHDIHGKLFYSSVHQPGNDSMKEKIQIKGSHLLVVSLVTSKEQVAKRIIITNEP